MHRILLLVFGYLSIGTQAFPQLILSESSVDNEISIHEHIQIADLGLDKLSFEEFRKRKEELRFNPVNNGNVHLGFTNHYYWLKFTIVNNSNADVSYYLDAARPITDLVELYLVSEDGSVATEVSGDGIPFSERSFQHNKSILPLRLKANERYEAYIHLGSDGEVINIPLVLHTAESLIKTGQFEWLIFGLFYGILFLATITYLFFYFGLGEKSFLFYSIYVAFIGLMQFALDGLFFQYFAPEAGWFSMRAVIIFASISVLMLALYAYTFLGVKKLSQSLNKAFYLLFGITLITLFAIFSIPAFLKHAYPTANFLGLIVLGLILLTIALQYFRKRQTDWFFNTGIFFLILGFVIFILNNFSLLRNSFITENSSKLGTGLEIIFLSLSMSNRIRILKSEKEEMQSIALKKAEETNEIKTYFLSNMSHELRTPINAILGMTNDILHETKSETIGKNAEIIKYSAIGLLSSVNDILDYSKMEREQLQLYNAAFSPLKTLSDIIKNAEIQAKDKGLRFEYSGSSKAPELLVGDAQRLSQILNNLLSNAIKFTPAGYVKLGIEFTERARQNLELIITVTDSGVGISKEKINSIYSSFSQVDISNKRKFGGLGLGLCIVKTLVDKHGGTIEVMSSEGQGTTFQVRLPYPYIESKSNQPKINTEQDYSLFGAHILVVEDDAINQMVIKIISKNWKNVRFTYANNGREALDVLKNSAVDLVLMDLQMPEMDGYEATIAIRDGQAGEEYTNLPIIALTADVMESARQKTIEIGMNAYLTKPVDQHILYATILRLLQRPLMQVS
jgi:signal transduction histidine kinase/ActR/RegA family two-component response regulator